MNKIKKWVKTHKIATTVTAIVLALAIVGGAFAAGVFELKTKVEVEQPQEVTLNVIANKDWTKDSTPVIVHIKNNKVDFYHAINATEDNKGKSKIKLDTGDYEMKIISPLNKDGSAYDTDTTDKDIKVISKKTFTVAPAEPKTDNKSKAETPKIDISLTKVSAEKITDKMVKDIVDNTKTAITNGDETLKGEKDTAIIAKVEANAKANPNVNKETKKTTTKTQPAKDKPIVNQPTSKPEPEQETYTSAPKTKKWVVDQPGHYEDIIEKVWVSKIVTVIDVPEYTKYVQEGWLYTFPDDGYTTTDKDDCQAHSIELVKRGYGGSYLISPNDVEQIVPAQTHEEDQGYYENKVTGQRWVEEQGHWE